MGRRPGAHLAFPAPHPAYPHRAPVTVKICRVRYFPGPSARECLACQHPSFLHLADGCLTCHIAAGLVESLTALAAGLAEAAAAVRDWVATASEKSTD